MSRKPTRVQIYSWLYDYFCDSTEDELEGCPATKMELLDRLAIDAKQAKDYADKNDNLLEDLRQEILQALKDTTEETAMSCEELWEVCPNVQKERSIKGIQGLIRKYTQNGTVLKILKRPVRYYLNPEK